MTREKREFIPIENHPSVLKVEKNGNSTSSFLKTRDENSPDGDITKESEGYSKLKKAGFRVPNHRVLSDKNTLVIKDAGVPINQILFDKPNIAFDSLDSALHNLVNVWKETKEKLNKEKLERDYTEGSLRTLEKILTTKSINIEKEIVINGVTYPSLKNTVEECRNNLLNKNDEIMVISHGDEYSSNITAEKNGNGEYTGQHNFIDPRNVGFYNISSVLNIMWGQTLLHNFKFSYSLQEDDDRVDVTYYIVPEQKKVYEKFCLTMKSFFDKVEKTLGVKPSLLNEYMFCNLARTLNDDTYKEKYVSRISPSKIAFFSIAMEIFYKKFKN